MEDENRFSIFFFAAAAAVDALYSFIHATPISRCHSTCECVQEQEEWGREKNFLSFSLVRSLAS